MRVILVRHGKAEAHSFDKPDSTRELTLEGREELQEHVPYLVSHLDKQMTTVYSSPLTRAIQTAEYFDEEPELVDFLATGNLQELIDCISEHGEKETLLFVGHEPILSDWVYELTGKMLVVKKGMAIVLDWPDKVVSSYKLKDYQSFQM